MSNAILYRMPYGVAGDITRQSQATTVEPLVLDSANAFPGFGLFGKISGGKFLPIVGGDTAADVYAFLLRPYPTQGANASDPLGTAVPKTTGIGDGAKRGYFAVHNNAGTPALKGSVYIRVATAVTGKPIGGIEAAPDLTVASAPGANTGTGTLGTLSVAEPALAGAYKVTFLTATTFSVDDPSGSKMKNGATAAAYSAGGVTFTITAGGTAFIAGDSFTVTVTANTIKVPGAQFMGAADAGGIAEIAYNI